MAREGTSVNESKGLRNDMKKLNEILGTEFPIIQGGMANIATGAFAAA